MGIVDDVLKAFDRIPVWQRLQEVPKEIDGVKERIAALEEKLGGKWPPDVCKFCGERAVRMTWSHPTGKGFVSQDWTCSACGQIEVRLVKP